MSLLPYLNKNKIEIGIDESGRGCLSGRVYAAVVILPQNENNIQYLPPDLAIQIRDSKKLSRKKRGELRKLIEQNMLDFAIGYCEPWEIDEINILQATFTAMHRALDNLQYDFDHIIVDGNRFREYGKYKHTTIVKGDDKYLSIAAASILAKEYHDEHVRELMQLDPNLCVYDWENNMCYPTRKHKEAIAKYGLSEYHRKTFKCM